MKHTQPYRTFCDLIERADPEFSGLRMNALELQILPINLQAIKERSSRLLLAILANYFVTGFAVDYAWSRFNITHYFGFCDSNLGHILQTPLICVTRLSVALSFEWDPFSVLIAGLIALLVITSGLFVALPKRRSWLLALSLLASFQLGYDSITCIHIMWRSLG